MSSSCEAWIEPACGTKLCRNRLKENWFILRPSMPRGPALRQGPCLAIVCSGNRWAANL
jgi:hypothetical protein